MEAFIREIFSSVQGEGPYIGLRQIFVRFEGCNLSCGYCDTAAPGGGTVCRVEVLPGKKKYIEAANPVSVDNLINILRDTFSVSMHHSVSITGGEPLLQEEYLAALLPSLKKMGLKIYLETNGTLPANLSRVIKMVDIVSMDIKLPGTSGCAPMWDRHSHFLSIAREALVFVKIVLDDQSDLVEYSTAIDLISRLDTGITLVIQPMTVGGRCVLSPDRALECQSIALERLRDVRIIPQAHVMMNQL